MTKFTEKTLLYRILSGFRESANDATLNFSLYLIAIFAGYVSSQLNDVTRLIDNIKNFETYKEKTIKKLEKLGATLDEEESEEQPNE